MEEAEKNYKMTIQYDGSRYKGWQSQKHTDVTIQGKISEVLTKMTGSGSPVEVHGSGRTDAGVHARCQTASVRIAGHFSAGEIMDYLNHYLPEDIGVTEVAQAPLRFHARLNAVKKTYVYRIWNSSVPNVFERKWMYAIAQRLDTESMLKAAEYLTGTHDFAAFCAAKQKKKSTVRTIYEIKVERQGDEVRIEVTGNGFLYHMVRIIAGTLVETGLGKRSPGDMTGLLESRTRENAGVTMPSKGLTLWQVWYPEEGQDKNESEGKMGGNGQAG